jgi:dTDP-4-amino-4,6-dideoxygalactose transaminase
MERIAVMWPRKQLDIDWADFGFGLWSILSRRPRPVDATVVPGNWVRPEESLVTLSVRSGWDMLLSALRLPAGSEVIVSAVTIPDMIRIIEHHGLVAVPVDVHADRLEPALEELERAITPRTRAILIAHLFGSRVDMAPIIQLAQQHNLMVIEDCAQAFVGSSYAGHAEADCSMFSFGPIKTATALGAAVLRIRDPNLRIRMSELQGTYPMQRRWVYLTRVAKYALFRLLLTPLLFGILVRAYRLLGMDYDRTFGNATHSFGKEDFFDEIRRQPCAPLVRLLERRLATFPNDGAHRLERRTERGDRLAGRLPRSMMVGGQNYSHTFWVVPIRIANPGEVVAALRSAGFDATGRSSLIVVRGPGQSAKGTRQHAPWIGDTVFLPNGDHMSDREWERMSQIVAETALVAEPCDEPGIAAPEVITASS